MRLEENRREWKREGHVWRNSIIAKQEKRPIRWHDKDSKKKYQSSETNKQTNKWRKKWNKRNEK